MANDPVHIKIKNFQSIEDVELEVNGFTVVTGRTNIGKSSLVRAISSAALNRPVIGSVRKGAKYASVEMNSKSYSFLWEKGEKGVNRYTIDGTTYDAIGKGQFSKVKEYGFGSVKVGDDEVHPWLADQFFPLFLLDKSGSQVTDFISEVSRLDVLQDAVTLSSRGKKKAVSDASLKDEEVLDLKKKEAELSECDKLSSVVSELLEQRASIEDYERRMSQAELVRSSIRSMEDSVEKLSDVDDVTVPSTDHDKIISQLSNAIAIDLLLKSSARSIIAVRGVSSIPVPESPSVEIDQLSSMNKFSTISDEIARLTVFDGIEKLRTPEYHEQDVKDLQRANTIRTAFLDSKKALDALVEVLDLKLAETPEDPGEMAKTTDLAAATNKIRLECEKLEKDLVNLNTELSTINESITLIPMCPTCERPVGHQ